MDEQHVIVGSLLIRRAGGTLGFVFEIPWEQLDQLDRDHPVTAIAAFDNPDAIESITAGVAQARHDALLHHKEQQEQNDPQEVQDAQPE